jgi:hypothetical protein
MSTLVHLIQTYIKVYRLASYSYDILYILGGFLMSSKIITLSSLVVIMLLTGCLMTPEERAEKRKQERAYETSEREWRRAYEKKVAEQREAGYGNTCLGYGYKTGTPQFNQCVATERRQYNAEQEVERASAERKKVAKALAKEMQRQSNMAIQRSKRACTGDDEWWNWGNNTCQKW